MTSSKEFLNSFSRVPVNRHFRYELISRSSEAAVISMEVLPDYLQEEGFVQGGIISAVADTAAVYTFYPDLDDNQTMTSIEFKMNFLRPALMDHGPLLASSKVIKRGRNVGLCDVEVTQEEKLCAKGSFTYMFMSRK
jgi:acyl-CoA thioesterase